MTNQVQVDKVIAYMNTVTAITDVLSNRIFFGQPIEEQSWIYLTINIIAESNAEMNKWTLSEFRFIGPSWNTFKELMDIRAIVSNNMLWRKSFDTFTCYWVTEETMRQWYGGKDEKIVIQDYRFYFVT